MIDGPDLSVPLQGRNVRHEPVAKPHGLRRLEVGEPAAFRPAREGDSGKATRPVKKKSPRHQQQRKQKKSTRG